MDLSLPWRWTSTYQNLKGWSSQKCELQSFVFQKVPIWQRLGGFEFNFRCLKWFLRKSLRKLRSEFFLKLRFLKIRLLLTWLKCLIIDVLNLMLLLSYLPFDSWFISTQFLVLNLDDWIVASPNRFIIFLYSIVLLLLLLLLLLLY